MMLPESEWELHADISLGLWGLGCLSLANTCFTELGCFEIVWISVAWRSLWSISLLEETSGSLRRTLVCKQ